VVVLKTSRDLETQTPSTLQVELIEQAKGIMELGTTCSSTDMPTVAILTVKMRTTVHTPPTVVLQAMVAAMVVQIDLTITTQVPLPAVISTTMTM
jgi:hypothetical protein